MWDHITSADELRQKFYYDPSSGFIYSKKTNRRVGSVDKTGHGYVRINYAGTNWLAHRLVWLLLYGTPAPGAIDHINGDKTDNRIANLRIVSQHANTHLAAKEKKNEIGTPGIRTTKNGKFQASIGFLYKKRHIGTFADMEDAKVAYRMAKELAAEILINPTSCVFADKKYA